MAQGLLGGVLPAIYSKADELKRGVYGLLTNPQEQFARASQSLLQSHNERQALMKQAFADPTNPTKVTDPQALNVLTQQVMAGELGFAPAGITAWHGSPHTFEKFDMSKVGTGEGAQAYGHGMYFGEARGTGEQYAKGLSYPDIKFMGEKIGNENRTLKPVDKWANFENLSKQEQNLLREAYHSGKSPIDWLESTSKIGEGKTERAIVSKQLLSKFEDAGNLYKVDIPDEHIPMMLDWDKPLSQQSKTVQEALAKIDPDLYSPKSMNYDPAERGQWIYMRLANDTTQKNATNKLNEFGIKGIRYLDNASRDAGKGTSNFVVFDPTYVKILERNDQPIESLLGN